MKTLTYIFLLAVILPPGCNNSDQADVTNKAGKGIRAITENDLSEIIKNRKGKILFLNVWATWCVPCVEEFPAIVQIEKNYRDKKVEVITISVDLPSEVDKKIIPFLNEQRAEFKVFVAEEKSSGEIIEMLNPEWSGAIPASFIYDENGLQHKFLLGAQSYEQMAKNIDSVQAL